MFGFVISITNPVVVNEDICSCVRYVPICRVGVGTVNVIFISSFGIKTKFPNPVSGSFSKTDDILTPPLYTKSLPTLTESSTLTTLPLPT